MARGTGTGDWPSLANESTSQAVHAGLPAEYNSQSTARLNYPGKANRWEPQLLMRCFRQPAAVPLLLSPANDPFVMHNELEPHGFVRIVNQSDQSGSVRILAVDDAGNAANPVERLGRFPQRKFASRRTALGCRRRPGSVPSCRMPRSWRSAKAGVPLLDAAQAGAKTATKGGTPHEGKRPNLRYHASPFE